MRHGKPVYEVQHRRKLWPVRFISLLLVLLVCGTGCGRFAARRMVQAPNTYPQWLAPKAPVSVAFNDKLLTVFSNEFVQIESPKAKLRYRIIEPAKYEFRSTHRFNHQLDQFELSFSANIDNLPQRTNAWTHSPRGTVVLVHGYGVAGFAMLPWALLLAEEGWRCVLVDLRGHGKSTGRQIYFGIQEVADLRALLDQLSAENRVAPPVSVVGHSFGAVLALRWSLSDSRIQKVVAISPYADLSKAVLSISNQYAPWLPDSFLRAGLRKLPDLLHVPQQELHPAMWMHENGRIALFVAGAKDTIVPVDQVELLHHLAGPGNQMLVVSKAGHEALPFYFDQLAQPVTEWLLNDASAVGTELSRSALGGL